MPSIDVCARMYSRQVRFTLVLNLWTNPPLLVAPFRASDLPAAVLSAMATNKETWATNAHLRPRLLDLLSSEQYQQTEGRRNVDAGDTACETVTAIAHFDERHAWLGMFNQHAVLVLSLPPMSFEARGCGMDAIRFWQPIKREENAAEAPAT